IVFDALGPGGQAGSSSRIENYLGFPTGLSGQELASRAAVQALKFGVRLVSPRPVDRIVRAGEDFFELTLQDGAKVLAKAVVLATGAVYRALDIPGYGRFVGHGIHHAATLMEAQLCGGEDIVIVGGGNSAGQAALYLRARPALKSTCWSGKKTSRAQCPSISLNASRPHGKFEFISIRS
ncbi:MAG: NAD(P)/FAD-dependent oxidoreductase, partial [Acidobacteriota bacterium]